MLYLRLDIFFSGKIRKNSGDCKGDTGSIINFNYSLNNKQAWNGVQNDVQNMVSSWNTKSVCTIHKHEISKIFLNLNSWADRAKMRDSKWEMQGPCCRSTTILSIDTSMFLLLQSGLFLQMAKTSSIWKPCKAMGCFIGLSNTMRLWLELNPFEAIRTVLFT